MYSILIECSREDEDLLSAALWELGTGGISEEPGGFRAFFEEAVSADVIAQKLGRREFEVRPEPGTDWAQISRDSFPPLAVGRRFWLVPPWCEDPAPEGRLRLEINPGMACGTGWHPCTQICLEALERHVRPGCSVLDVGTGSGILSEAAMLLGAGFTAGCDIDPEAVAVARERVGASFFVGSAPSVASRSCNLLVANISSAAVEELGAEFRRVCKPGAVMILSGFPEWDVPEGIGEGQVLRKEEWACLVIAL